MNQPLALIVDDEPDIRELLDITLQRMRIDTRGASSVQQALAELAQHHFDLCLADMRLPDGDGIAIVRHIAQHFPHTPVAMITAHGNMDSAVQALKAGAFDFVSKPVDLPVLRRLVDTALRLGQLDEKNVPAAQQASTERTLLGTSSAIEQVRLLIHKLARSQAPVFIRGESGTGKELAARLIHQNSARSERNFVAVNCGAIPSELMESELFGHTKGSFTGAVRDHEGLFKAADGGTLFLDEVADLPLDMQVKLLRAIQEKRIRPVGSPTEIDIDVRLISATHGDIARMVSEDQFRQDLYYRIHVIELIMPPLRERPGDIPQLVDHLLQRIAEANRIAQPRLSEAALQALRDYDFLGNVRELENILERACALCEGGKIAIDDLGLPGATTNRPLPPQLQPEATDGTPDPDQQTPQQLEAYLEQIERNVLSKTLEETHWNRTLAAKKLGITLRSLRYRMDKLGLGSSEDEDG